MTLLALVSDTHDNVALVRSAVAFLHERRPDLILHLGDLETAAVIPYFAGLPVRFLRGNNDHDPAIAQALADAGLPPLADEWTGEIDGLSVAATHGHRRNLVHRHLGRADVLLHGHTHVRRAEKVGPTLVVNPGALYRAAPRTMALLRLPEGEVEWHEVTEDGVRPCAAP